MAAGRPQTLDETEKDRLQFPKLASSIAGQMKASHYVRTILDTGGA